MKTGAVLAKPEAELTEPEKTVRSAAIHGGRMSLRWTALLSAIMAAGYLGLILHFRARGGYQPVHLQGTGTTAKEMP